MTSFEEKAESAIEQCELSCGKRGSCFLRDVNTSIGEIALANEHEADDVLRSDEVPSESEIAALEMRLKLVQSLYEVAANSCALNQE